MKILHVIPSVAAVHGGPSIMAERMTRTLSAAGIEVHLATTNDDWPGKLDVACGVPRVRDGVTYWYFDRELGFYKYSGPLGRWLAAHVADYDVVHIHALFSWSSYAAGKWARRRGVPYIVRPLGVLNRWGMENRRPWLKQLSFRFVDGPIVRHAALMHYTAEAEREEAAAIGVNGPSVIIPNPVPDPLAERGAASGTPLPVGKFRAAYPELGDGPIVLFLSRIDRKKGLELLLPAFARVRQSYPAARLVVAGGGDNELLAELQAQARQLGIDGCTVWPGFLKGEEKLAAFLDAEVFVLPSWSENFGIAVVEAMAAGCPVVVSDQVAIHGEIARAGAGYVARCDAESVADAVCRVLGDSRARETMGNEGKCLTQTHYSPEAFTRKMVAAYSAVMKGRQA